VIGEEGKSGDKWMNLSGYSVVSPSFLQTLGIPILRGRDFAPGDATGPAPVAIVDADAAARLWPDVPDPVGRMLKLGAAPSRAPWVRVVGVTPAVEYEPRLDPDLPPEPIVYVVLPNDPMMNRQLVVRATSESGARGRQRLAVLVRRDLQVVMPTAGAITVTSWLQDYEGRRQEQAFMASLFGAFAAFGLALCAVGLYGVLAYTVSRREREFAVRIALGARRRDVARLVVHDAAVTALAGVGLGAFVALFVTRTVSDSVGTIPYADVTALVAAEAALFLVALAASLGPVRRAAAANPVEILRAI
jgi:putative ABC transport system permease protein